VSFPSGGEGAVGLERYAGGDQAWTRQPLVAFVELDLVAEPERRGIAQGCIDAAEVEEAAAALRHVDVAHGFERHAHDQPERLAFRLDERLHPHLVGNVVRARVWRKGEQQA
jgi:hypothetical protein